ncbi:hypothetical protein Baya_8156 [Bagarius yarrelli]|uniref:Uncharacterized protein n=1 Tax=Bagarius yarrelli TaxID=175774 RepID=A0A556U5D5_BAGYA|nr:hypothetical protein Baya_8156 [Bagarius yarrelli]
MGAGLCWQTVMGPHVVLCCSAIRLTSVQDDLEDHISSSRLSDQKRGQTLSVELNICEVTGGGAMTYFTDRMLQTGQFRSFFSLCLNLCKDDCLHYSY